MQVGFIQSNAGSIEELNINSKEFYFKEENKNLIISENGGSIRAQIDEEDQDCLVLKVIQKIPHASLQGSPVQEGSTYFMEVGEKLSYQETTFELKSIDLTSPEVQVEEVEELILEVEEKPEIEAKPEIKEVEEVETEDDDDISFEIASDDRNEDTNEPEQEEKENPKDSMSITQVLNVAQVSQELEQPRQKASKKKASEKKKKEPNFQLGAARDYQGNKAKRDAKKKVQKKQEKKKKTGLDGSNLVGPFTRFISAISLLFVTILVSAQVEVAVFESLSVKLASKINEQLANYTEFTINPEFTKVFVILLGILFISNLLFSVSPTLFICGATTKGSFLSKRAKAVLRTPLDFIAHFIPLFEIPTIFDTPSLKELITRGAISYRIRAFRFIPIFTLSIFVTLVIGYPIIQESLTHKNPPKQIQIPKELGKRPVKFNEVIMSKIFSQQTIALRIPSTRPVYFFINKESGHTLLLRNTTSNFFKTFQKTFESIPFFKYRYPYLASFFKDEKSSFLVREDFGKILWGGEIIKGQDTKNLRYVDLLAITQSKKVFDHFKLPYTQYINLNKFSSYYKSKDTEVYLYIGEDAVMQFTNDGGNMTAKELEGLSFMAKPKIKIEHVDSVEKAYKGTNKSILMSQLHEVNNILMTNGDPANNQVFKQFAQYLAQFLQGSGNSVGQQAAKEILTLSTLNN